MTQYFSGMLWCLGCMSIMTPIGVSMAMVIVSALDENTILIVSGKYLIRLYLNGRNLDARGL